jgi:hypothetical protein
MTPGSVRIPGDPGKPESGSRVVVACPDCHWHEITDRPRLTCPKNAAHRRPLVVKAYVACTKRCWANWFDRYPAGCSAGTAEVPHLIRLTKLHFPS